MFLPVKTNIRNKTLVLDPCEEFVFYCSDHSDRSDRSDQEDGNMYGACDMDDRSTLQSAVFVNYDLTVNCLAK